MTDQLPEDLDVTAYVGPYTFPDTRRRRGIALVYAAAVAGVTTAWLTTDEGAFAGAAVLMAIVGVVHLLAGWPLRVNENEALLGAVRAVGFPVGHASAQLAFRGLRSRPTWRILLYSADDPPSKRALVELDAVDGALLGTFIQDNPEDWSEYRAAT